MNLETITRELTKLKVGIVIAILGSSLLFWRIIIDPSLLWGDNFDTRLLLWTIEWGYHILVEEGDFLNFWNANSFYPHQTTLAYSDSLLSGQLFYSPARIIGLAPLQALYFTLICWCVAGCIFSDWALRKLDFLALERAIIIFAAHFGLQVTGFLTHYQLFAFHLAFPFLLLCYIYLRNFRYRHLLLITVTFCFCVSYSMYLAPMLVTLSVISLTPILLIKVRRQGIRTVLSHFTVLRTLFVLSLISVFYYVQIHPYTIVADQFASQSFSESWVYSTRLDSIFNQSSIQSLWFSDVAYAYGDWERTIFPGYVLLCSAAIFAVYATSGLSTSINTSTPSLNESRSFQFFILSILITAWALSLGPYLDQAGETKLPFYYLSMVFPGLDSIRAPGRFGMFLGLPLGIILVWTLRIVSRTHAAPNRLSAFVLLVMVVELLPNHRTFVEPTVDATYYTELSHHVPPNQPLIELPVAGEGHIDTLMNVMHQLNASQYHWARLFVGYGAKFTDEHHQIIGLDNNLKNGIAALNDLMNFATSFDVSFLSIDISNYPEDLQRELETLLKDGDRATLIFKKEDRMLIKLIQTTP